jgi:hypothetical protein
MTGKQEFARRLDCTHFPAADAEEEAQYIGLLALLQFFDVLEGTLQEREYVSFLLIRRSIA